MENPKNDVSSHSFEKLIDHCQFWVQMEQKQSESKESTHEESYDEMVKYRASLRRKNYLLKQDLKKYKQQILSKCLGIYIEQLNELNKENLNLRSQYNQKLQNKKPSSHISSSSIRHSLKTPKSANIITLGDQQIKCKQQGRKSLINQAAKRINIQGRNSLQCHKFLKKNQSKMNQGKIDISSRFSKNNDMHSAFSSLQSSLRPSIDKENNNTVNYKSDNNMFLRLINVILKEEKLKQKQYYEVIQEEKNSENITSKQKQERFFINILENEAIETEKNIQHMKQMLKQYQNMIKEMKMEINIANKMTKELCQLREQFIQMQSKCSKINSLKKEVAMKNRRLEELYSTEARIIQPPQSMKLMLRIYGASQNKINGSKQCRNQMNEIIYGKKGKLSKNKMKAKQLLDTVYEGRKKFKELLKIYNGRISKLETKIQNLKQKENNRRKKKPA